MLTLGLQIHNLSIYNSWVQKCIILLAKVLWHIGKVVRRVSNIYRSHIF